MTRDPSMGMLLDHAQDLIVLLDESGRFTYVNDAMERVVGWDPDAVVGENAFDYVHPDDRAATRAAFDRTIVADGFTETSQEHRFRAPDGSWVWLESRMSNLTDGELDGYVVSARDITDRVAAQRERERATTRLREIAASSGDVLWLFSGDWSELLFVNPAYEDVFGGSLDDLEADPETFLETVHPEDVPAVRDAMAALSGGEPVDVEYRVDPETEYGTWVWVQGDPIVEDGEVVRIAGFARDITDRRRRERQLAVMDNLLRHNLRNDLNVMLGQASFVEEEGEEAVAESAAVIRRTGEELLASAEKQRDIIDCLTRDGTPRAVDLAAVAADAAETVRDRYPAARVEARTPETAVAYALPEVELAVVELLENAIRHSDRDHPTVGVEVAVEAETVRLTVTDDGPPIPAPEAEVLTGDLEMTNTYHSTGMGLWLVHWSVERSGGRVQVSASDADGNRVVLELPRGGGRGDDGAPPGPAPGTASS